MTASISGTGTGRGMRALRRARARRWPMLILTTGSVLVTAMGIKGCVKSASEPATHTIAIRSFEFMPEALTVRAGDTIVWANQDVVPHTATAVDGAWDTGSLATRQSGILVLDTPGTYGYVCAFHPNMTAVVTVE